MQPSVGGGYGHRRCPRGADQATDGDEHAHSARAKAKPRLLQLGKIDVVVLKQRDARHSSARATLGEGPKKRRNSAASMDDTNVPVLRAPERRVSFGSKCTDAATEAEVLRFVNELLSETGPVRRTVEPTETPTAPAVPTARVPAPSP
jgi:hypothetical protein